MLKVSKHLKTLRIGSMKRRSQVWLRCLWVKWPKRMPAITQWCFKTRSAKPRSPSNSSF